MKRIVYLVAASLVSCSGSINGDSVSLWGLGAREDYVVRVTMPVDGRTVWFGDLVIENTDSKSITVAGVEALGQQGSIRVEGFAFAETEGQAIELLGCGRFPPEKMKTHDVSGFEVQPTAKVSTLVAISVDPGYEGVSRIRGFAFQYSIGSRAVRQEFDFRVEVTTKSTLTEDCRNPS